MHAERTTRPHRTNGGGGGVCKPRVVIFVSLESTRVEVLDLAPNTAPGDRIRHDGKSWRITGSRTGSRVLIAEPESN